MLGRQDPQDRVRWCVVWVAAHAVGKEHSRAGNEASALDLVEHGPEIGPSTALDLGGDGVLIRELIAAASQPTVGVTRRGPNRGIQ